MANLFYVIGASGAGKDSLLCYAREKVGPDAPVVFAHRYITRPADAGGENHIALSEQEFFRLSNNGCFAMLWRIHETRYGIGIEINQWLAKGLNVVVNGSRAYLTQAARKYPELAPVLVSARLETLRARLEGRGREKPEEIEKRLSIATELDKQIEHPRLTRIDNNADLSSAGEKLVRLLHPTSAGYETDAAWYG